MKDLLKKIGSILVCISLVGALAACGGKEDSDSKDNNKRVEDKKKEVDKANPKDVVDAYLSAAFELDFEGALEYISEDSELYEGMESLKGYGTEAAVDEIVAGISQESGMPEEVMDTSRSIFADFLEEALGAVEYEVTIDEESDDEVTASYTVISPDYENGMVELMEETFSDDDLNERYGDRLADIESEEEAIEVMQEILPEIFEEAFDGAVDKLEKVETSGTITLEKVDDAWLIVADDEE